MARGKKSKQRDPARRRAPTPARAGAAAEDAELPKPLARPLAAALVFVAAGAVLMREMLAVRLLAP
ncbi:MAG: hypothetical protein ACOYD4_16920, partial [Solirubrobacterales bacterium]